ncbi:MAG TPA: ferritin family protein [Pseudohaliea sp.]|nr:ferritin family protein [Pseudohaliea sp.]
MNGPTPELLHFLAHACELEEEAHDRYTELADALDAHNNTEVAGFFRAMAEESSRHLAEVSLIAAGLELPTLKAWEYDWPGTEAPESASHEAAHYRMTVREAMELALAQERSAGAFYRARSEQAKDEETRRLAAEFADEEAEHAERLALRLQDLPLVSEVEREDDDPPHMPE